ncbi:hypothetical protein ACFLX4_01765 [Chloroflexota bacterium]
MLFAFIWSLAVWGIFFWGITSLETNTPWQLHLAILLYLLGKIALSTGERKFKSSRLLVNFTVGVLGK